MGPRSVTPTARRTRFTDRNGRNDTSQDIKFVPRAESRNKTVVIILYEVTVITNINIYLSVVARA